MKGDSDEYFNPPLSLTRRECVMNDPRRTALMSMYRLAFLFVVITSSPANLSIQNIIVPLLMHSPHKPT